MTARPHTVLLAVGDEEPPDTALVYAVRLAELDSPSVLRLVHVLPRREENPAHVNQVTDLQSLRLVGERLLKEAADHVRANSRPDLVIETATLFGPVVPMLYEQTGSAAVAVLQHRSLSRLRRVVTGSVTSGLAEVCPIPLVSVPQFWVPWPAHQSRVTVGIGEVLRSRRLLEHAMQRADRLALPLLVLHAWYFPLVYLAGVTEPALADVWERETLDVLEREVATARAAHPSVEVETRVVRGRPADALTAASRESSLVVVSRSDQTPQRLGSVSRALLRESLCPVEVIPVPRGG